ncbi:hypothetical protein LCGC14_0408900 [marine sediment metagenome]|uniref:Uncharacterized protein n=1 Tax=marine sediment metagenome TaxID=412755 RepID=A0A0F9W3K9_9ZZZZ
METDCLSGGRGHCNNECPFWKNNKCSPPEAQGTGRETNKELVAFSTMNEWLDAHSIDRAYKKDMKETYLKEKEEDKQKIETSEENERAFKNRIANPPEEIYQDIDTSARLERPSVLFHKVIHQPEQDIVASIKANGILPQLASAYKDLVPETISAKPVIWLASKLHSYTDAPVFLIETSALDMSKLHPMENNSLDWWVYEGSIPATNIVLLSGNPKIGKQIWKEQLSITDGINQIIALKGAKPLFNEEAIRENEREKIFIKLESEFGFELLSVIPLRELQ